MLTWAEGTLNLPAGATALLPADRFDLKIAGNYVLLSYPTV